MVYAAVRSKAVILLFVYLLFVGSIFVCVFFCVLSMFCGLVPSIFLFGNHLAEEEVAGCFYFVLWLLVVCTCLFLMVPWVGLHSVIVACPGHTHLLLLDMH